jgi:hypothetical protein
MAAQQDKAAQKRQDGETAVRDAIADTPQPKKLPSQYLYRRLPASCYNSFFAFILSFRAFSY